MNRRPRDSMQLPWQSAPPSERQVADEFTAYLQREWPQVNARDSDGDSLALTLPDGAEGKLFLHKLHGAVGRMRRNNFKRRQQVYADFARQMLSAEKQIPDLNALGGDEVAVAAELASVDQRRFQLPPSLWQVASPSVPEQLPLRPRVMALSV